MSSYDLSNMPPPAGPSYPLEVPDEARGPLWRIWWSFAGLFSGVFLSVVFSIPLLIVYFVLNPPSDPNVATDDLEKFLLQPIPVLISTAGLWAGIWFAAYFPAKRVFRSSMRSLYNIRVARQDFWLVPAVVLGLFLLQLGASALLTAAGVDTNDVDNTQILKGQPLYGTIIVVLMVVLGAPFFEELLFRGLMLSAMTVRLGPVVAVLVSSAIFGILHISTSASLAGAIGLFLITGALGVVLAVVRLKTGRLGTTMLIHAGMNATVAAITLLS